MLKVLELLSEVFLFGTILGLPVVCWPKLRREYRQEQEQNKTEKKEEHSDFS